MSDAGPRGGQAVVRLDLGDLSRGELKKYGQSLVSKAVIDLEAQLVKVVYEAVVETTPVLSGQARNNWRIGVGVMPEGIHPGGTGIEVTGTPMTGEEASRASAAGKELRGTGKPQKVWVTNNLSYVPGLDEGDSTKAPLGIRAIAVDRALSVGLKGIQGDQDSEGGE